MRITATKDDLCEVHSIGFEDFCKEMEWELFTPSEADFVHDGWRVSIEHEIADGVYAPMSDPWMRITNNRKAMLNQYYTPSLRKVGKDCGSCIFRKGDACSIGRFKVKMNGGCKKFKTIDK